MTVARALPFCGYGGFRFCLCTGRPSRAAIRLAHGHGSDVPILENRHDDKQLRLTIIDELDFEPSVEAAHIGVAVKTAW